MNWKRAVFATLAAVPLILLLGWGFSRDPRDIPSPLPGRDAPMFALPVFAPGQPPLDLPVGETIDLTKLRGQVVVLNFWASWCLACRDEHQTLTQTALHYAGKPVRFVGVLYNDRIPPALDWIRDMGGQSYPSVQDEGARTAIDYGLYGVPETFFIDVNGRVARKQIGPATAEILTRVVDSLLNAATMAPPAAKTGL